MSIPVHLCWLQPSDAFVVLLYLAVDAASIQFVARN